MQGPKDLRRAFPDCLLMSALVPFPSECQGSERRLRQAEVAPPAAEVWQP